MDDERARANAMIREDIGRVISEKREAIRRGPRWRRRRALRALDRQERRMFDTAQRQGRV